jgi:GAF domain-containing protein
MTNTLCHWWEKIPRRRRFRLSIRAVAIVLAAIFTYWASWCFETDKFLQALIPSSLLLLVAAFEFLFGDVLTERRFPAHTEEILQRYRDRSQRHYDELVRHIDKARTSLNGCDPREVSGTIHLLIETYSAIDDRPDFAFVQLTSYSGQLGGPKWRLTRTGEGIIGRCYRTGKSEYVNFSTREEYTERMVSEFGFTKPSMEKRTMDARSYWAQPLLSERKVVGVLYLFSTEPQTFPLSASTEKLNEIADDIVGLLRASELVT